MMTPASSKDASERPATAPAVGEPALESLGTTPSVPAGIELSDLTVLGAVMGQNEPLTLKRIAKLTDVPPAQLRLALDALCELGLLRRLNTIVESYTARFQ
jgi:IclR helix-turn-helix domain